LEEQVGYIMTINE